MPERNGHAHERGHGIDLGRAKEALQALPPDLPRDEWVRAGMAAHAAGLPFDDFDAWSAGGASYDARAARDVWRSFKHGKGVGPGTLYAMARKAGWGPAGAAEGIRQPRPSAPPRHPQAERPRKGPSAAEVWAQCLPAPESHPYILAKQGTAEGLRVVPLKSTLKVAGTPLAGALAVPLWADGVPGDAPASLQYIFPPDVASELKAQGRPGKLTHPGPMGTAWFTVGEASAGGTVFVVEGIGQGWAALKASGAAATVCFGAGRMRAVAQALRQRDASARLVLAPDVGKEREAEAVAREVSALIATMPADWPPNADLADLALRDGHDAVEALLAKAQQPQITSRLEYVRAADVADVFNPVDELVEGLLTVGGSSIIYGDSNSGKTFVAVALAFAVSRGEAFFGRRTEGGLVVYLAAESPSSVVIRVGALQRFHGVTAPDLVIVRSPIDLFSTDADADEIVTLVRQIERGTGRKARLIVGDTLARMSAGANENAGQDMGAVVGRVDRIRQETGAHFLLVHHSGKAQAAGARGWSGLRAAVDSEVEVTDSLQGRCAEITKQRDLSTKGDRIGFRLEVIELGSTKWGKPATTCVAVPADAPPKQITAKRMGEIEGAVIEFLAARRVGVRKTEVVKHFEGRYDKGPVYRAIKALVTAHAAHEASGMVVIAEAAK